MMRWGSRAEWLAALAAEGKVMKAQRDKVVVWPHLEFYQKAFLDLSPSRPVGMGGEGYIPISEMLAYCEMMDVSPEQRPEFLELVRQMDYTFMEERRNKRDAEEAEKEAQAKAAKAPPPKPPKQPRRSRPK